MPTSEKTRTKPTQPVATAAPVTKENLIQQLVDRYGDMVFDLCQAVLWSQPNAQLAFRAIVRDLRRLELAGVKYERYERPWILRVACEKLRSIAVRHGRTLSASERMMLDGALKGDARLRQFDSYFHRLRTDDQILLLLRDKYKLDYAEIAMVMGEPEGSLKMRRQHAMRALDEMLWDTV